MKDQEILFEMLGRAGIKLMADEERMPAYTGDDGTHSIEFIQKDNWIRFNFNQDGSLKSINGRDS